MLALIIADPHKLTLLICLKSPILLANSQLCGKAIV